MSFGGSEQTSDSKSQTTLDPDIKAALLQNFGQTKNTLDNTPYEYGGQGVAPLNSDQGSYIDTLRKLSGANVGTGTLNGAVSGAAGVAALAPKSLSWDPFSATTADPNAAGTVSGAGPSSSDISSYLNPYIQSTVDANTADLEHQRGIALNGNAGSAAMAGAFGSAGQALQDGETNRGFAQAEAQTGAQLRSQGYQSAVDAAQQDSARKLAAGQSNQATSLQAILANLGFKNSADQANAQGKLTADTSAAGLGLSGAQTLGQLAPQQLALATDQAGLQGQAGGIQQQQQQQVDTYGVQNFQDNLSRLLSLIQTKNQSLGLAGNPTIGNSSSSSQGVSLKLGKG